MNARWLGCRIICNAQRDKLFPNQIVDDLDHVHLLLGLLLLSLERLTCLLRPFSHRGSHSIFLFLRAFSPYEFATFVHGFCPTNSSTKGLFRGLALSERNLLYHLFDIYRIDARKT